jgi:hypothetical protein
MAQIQQTFEQNLLLGACQPFHFLVPQHIQGPNTAQQCAGQRYYSKPCGTVAQVETLFVGLNGSQSRLIVRANSHVFLWSNIHFNLAYISA